MIETLEERTLEATWILVLYPIEGMIDRVTLFPTSLESLKNPISSLYSIKKSDRAWFRIVYPQT